MLIGQMETERCGGIMSILSLSMTFNGTAKTCNECMIMMKNREKIEIVILCQWLIWIRMDSAHVARQFNGHR